MRFNFDSVIDSFSYSFSCFWTNSILVYFVSLHSRPAHTPAHSTHFLVERICLTSALVLIVWMDLSCTLTMYKLQLSMNVTST